MTALKKLIKGIKRVLLGDALYQAHVSPFLYQTVETEDLRIGDYVVAHAGYIQYISPPDVYTGTRIVTVRNGKAEPVTFEALEMAEFAVRVHNPDYKVE